MTRRWHLYSRSAKEATSDFGVLIYCGTCVAFSFCYRDKVAFGVLCCTGALQGQKQKLSGHGRHSQLYFPELVFPEKINGRRRGTPETRGES